MLEHLMQYRLVRMAKVLGVSRSGFYYWIDNRHKVTQRNEHRKQLDSKVREAFDDKKERDGARRIQKELEANGNKARCKNHCREHETPELSREGCP